MQANDIQALQDEIIAEFSRYQNWDDRYAHIIKLGKDLPDMPDELKTEQYRVQGCQSQVWMHAGLAENGGVHYQTTSDALIVRGLIALLMRVYNHQPPQVIVQTEPRFMEEIGMAEHLSMTRRNGLAAMLKQLKLYATVLMMQAQTQG